MNNLEKYVHHVQPVVQAINAHDNPSYLLQYFNLSPQDLVSDPGNNLVEFQTAAKNLPEHFNGTMPAVLAQWGEETDAALVLQVSPDHYLPLKLPKCCRVSIMRSMVKWLRPGIIPLTKLSTSY